MRFLESVIVVLALLGCNVDAVNAQTTAKSVNTDLDSMLNAYQGIKNATPGRVGPGGDLLVFVSFSMPEQELNSLARQAKEYGGTLILRGFKDNRLSETKAAALKLNASGASWKIHPQLFKTFSVNQVPAIVVASDASNQLLANGCAPDAAFTSIYGAQSIELSLRKIIEQSRQKDIVRIANSKLDEYYRAGRLGG